MNLPLNHINFSAKDVERMDRIYREVSGLESVHVGLLPA